ncbi:hypothetical protein ACA910_013034 [Epithemia clementina (nom. ined.)]
MRKGIFYGLAILFVFSVSIIVVLEPFIPLKCDENAKDTSITYANPSYSFYPCRHERMGRLLFLTPEECDFGRRLVASVVLGGIIGWERRMADRPAGIRTMSLVSLASCLFTICSAFAFISGPMEWDASRISAAIPSGVGFLGAGLIFKEAQKDESGHSQHVVHGLTTATSVWLSAAVGVGCGGELYLVSMFSTAIMLVLLRFGPRQRDFEAHEEEEERDHNEEQKFNRPNTVRISYGTADKDADHSNNDGDRETDPMLPQNDDSSTRTPMRRADSKMSNSMRNRPAISTIL